jgi:hypothetical protein
MRPQGGNSVFLNEKMTVQQLIDLVAAALRRSA